MNDEKTVIQDYLVPDKRNSDSFDLLFKTFTPFKAVSFIGAGSSMPLGIQDWKGLIRKLEKELGSTATNSDSNDLPKVAEELYKQFEAAGKEQEFDRIVFDSTRPSVTDATGALIKLVLLVDTHITTNFDMAIKGVYEFLTTLPQPISQNVLEHTLPSLPKYSSLQRNGANAQIIYLHGNCRDKYVFRLRDYAHFYPTEGAASTSQPSSAIRDFLKEYLSEVSFIFVGFSFSDSYVKDMIFNVIREIKRDIQVNQTFLGTPGGPCYDFVPRHFWLMDSGEESPESLEKTRNIYEDFFIHPIFYKRDKHIFVQRIFEQLKLEVV